MQSGDFPNAPRLEKFREYLRLLSRVQLGAAWGGAIDPSDLVQQTLLEAYQKRNQFRGSNDAERGAWLRAILARNLADAIRRRGRRKTRHQSRAIARGGSRIVVGLPGRGLPLSSRRRAQAVRHEQAVLVANALAQLPSSQREAIVLHYWQGFSLADIAARLERKSGRRGRAAQARD